MPNATLEWRFAGWREEVLVDDTGRIIGRVSGGHRCYYAHSDVRALGEYVDSESAKRAVQQALRLRAPDA